MSENREARYSAAASALGSVCNKLSELLDGLSEAEVPVETADWLRIRARIGRVVSGIHDALGHSDELFGVSSARGRILSYLKQRQGQVVDKDDLRGVAGISEWARRVRELREDEGWVIHSHTTDLSMSPGEYCLVSSEPRRELVRGWSAAKEVAKLRQSGAGPGPADRLLLLLERVRPHPVAVDQAQHAVGKGCDLDDCVVELVRRGCKVRRLPSNDVICPGGFKLGGRG